MAGYRQFHTQFWKDEFVIELDPLERYLFMYLFTNEMSNIAGIYKLPMRVIANETGLALEFIETTLEKFQRAEKIFYHSGVMWVVNMRKFHQNASPKTMTKVQNLVNDIPDGLAKKAYLYHEKTGKYSIDTVSILNSEILSESESVNENISDNGSGWIIENPELAEINTVYEHNIGALTPMIGELIESDLKEYGLTFCKDAILEAVKANVRKWSYVRGILKTWKAQGRSDGREAPHVPRTVKVELPSGEIVETTI